MGKKTENLKQLVEQGFNVHEFQELKTEAEIRAYCKENPVCSVRFDRGSELEQLPFYVFEEEPTEEQIQSLLVEAEQLHCTLLASNGHRYDPLQICNFVGILRENDSFLLEISTKKVPLRRMYDWDTTTIQGTLLDSPKHYQREKASSNPITDAQIEQILLYLMKLNQRNCYVEGTLYQENVGIQNQPIVIWQTRKENTNG